VPDASRGPSAGPGDVSEVRDGARACRAAGRPATGMGLSDASADRARRARLVPDLWDGARTANHRCRERPRSGTRRHDASLLDRSRPDIAASRGRDGRHATRAAASPSDSGPSVRVGSAGPRHAGRAVGWLVVLHARVDVDHQPQPEHVHAHRARHRRGLGVQRGGDSDSGALPGVLSNSRRTSSALLRGGGHHHRPCPARAGARAARA
jgi:hypothetical protein